MKKLLLLVLLALPVLAAGQDCSGKLKAARASKADGNYRKALEQFTAAASSCGKDHSTEIEKEILGIYFEIERLKDEAVKAQKLAKTEEEKAKASQKLAADALIQVQEANRKTNEILDSLKLFAENLSKSNAECAVRLLLAEVERYQKAGNFDMAVEKVKAAKSAGALTDSVENAYQFLSNTLLSLAWEDLRRKEFKPALSNIKNAKELDIQPDSVAALSKALALFLRDNARRDIMNTRYDEASEKISALSHLQVPKDTIESLWFEIAFCYTETGRLDRAAAALDTLAQMRNNNTMRNLFLDLAGKEPVQQTQVLRQARHRLDPQRDSALTTLYLTPVFRKIPEGTITMGGVPGDTKQGECQVTVKSFSLAAKEVTFFEYDIFCAATNRPKTGDGSWGRGLLPVINIDWYDAVEFCNWRSRQEGLQEAYVIAGGADDLRKGQVTWNPAANGYRLPTETEWEYAAGNGTKHTRYSWGDELPTAQKGGNVSDETVKAKFPGSEIFKGYSDGYAYTSPTGSYPPNDFGLYDMTGNVWEWCWDRYDDSYCRANKNKTPPQGPSTGPERVLRGGSWQSYPKDCFTNTRFFSLPDARKTSFGFRLAKN